MEAKPDGVKMILNCQMCDHCGGLISLNVLDQWEHVNFTGVQCEDDAVTAVTP